MIPWSISPWSTNDVLRSVGVDRAKFTNVFACNQYLYAHGHIERVPGVLTFHDEAMTAAALERS